MEEQTRYECPGPECPKTFTRLQSVIRHGKTCSYYNGHFEILPIRFWCAGEGCEKSYTRTDALFKHQQTCTFFTGDRTQGARSKHKPIDKAIADAQFEDPPFDQSQQGWTVVFDQGPTVSWRVGHLESEPPTIATILRALAMECGAWDKLKHDGDLSLDYVLRYMNLRNLGHSAQIEER